MSDEKHGGRADARAPVDAGDAARLEAVKFAELSRTYATEGRYQDLAKLIEGVLAQSPPLPAEDDANLRVRLVLLYRDALREPQRAIHHLEKLLRGATVSEPALEAAESLMEVRLLAHRLAPVLADAYARLRRPHDELAVLSRELKMARAPRLGEVQRRLALLRLDVLDDVQGALELLGPLVISNPADDEARRRYLEISARADRTADAARALSRALHYAKDDAIRARVGYDIGCLHLSLGDATAAQAAFEQVTKAGGKEDAVLASGRKLLELLGPSGDPKKLARALQVVAELEPGAKRKHEAARRLAELTETFKLGNAYAIVAWRALIEAEEGTQALERLERLATAAGDNRLLAEVLDLQAARSRDRATARQLALRSVELRASGGDAVVALHAWQKFVERYGASRDALARIAELLEQGKQWEELAQVLEAEVALAPPEERAQLWAKLGRVRLERVSDTASALVAFRNAIALDGAEPTSRAALERLLERGRFRLEASEILEPLYRAEGQRPRLIGLLEVRATLVADPAASMKHLAEAAALAESDPPDPARGIEICRRALHAARAADRSQLRPWLERLGRFTSTSNRSDLMAEISLEVIGDSDKLEPELVEFARVAAEALVASGNIGRAQAFLERALAEDPTSPPLLARIDAILARDGGTPAERIRRYRRALELSPTPERWRELMHVVADLERRALGSPNAASATLQAIADRHPDDWAAHVGLVELHGTLGNTAALDAELERGLSRFQGPQRQLTLVRRIARLADGGEEARALELCRTLLNEPDLTDDAFDAVEKILESSGDFDGLRQLLERRVSSTKEPARRADALERLGNFFLEQLGESTNAAELWRTGASLCGELPGELERARHLYERVLDVFPSDREAARRLVEIYASAGQWAKVPEVYAVCVRDEGSDAERVEVLLALAPRAARAGAADEFIALADEALWRAGPQDTGLGRKILAAKASVLAASPTRQRDAGQTFRNLVDSYGDEGDVRTFLGFLDETPEEDERRDGLRWVFQWRAARAPDPRPVLFEWAAEEETRLGDRDGATAVYERIVARDGGNRAALEHLARLRLAGGRLDGALEALEALRAASSVAERSDLDVRMTELALGRPDRAPEAIPYLARALSGLGATESVLGLGQRVLAHRDAQAGAAQAFEAWASGANGPEAARVTTWLLQTTEPTPELRVIRCSWWKRLLEARTTDDHALLSTALRAASEFPDDDGFWSEAEALGRKTSDTASIGAAYQGALEQSLEPEVAERVGARAADFFEQVLGDPAGAVTALGRTLAMAPKARWALDRVKLTLTLQRRYEELLELYDRAILAEVESSIRAELLDEAVVVARDLATDPDLAMGYLEQLAVLRPSDGRIEAGLERLYERRGHTRKLIDLLDRRLVGLPEASRADVRLRIAGLWVELHQARQALVLTEPSLADAAHRERARGLLEKITTLVALPEEEEQELLRAAQRRAAALLKREYREAGLVGEVVRVAELEVELFDDPAEKILGLESVVALCLESLKDTARAFEAQCELVRLDPDEPLHRARAATLADAPARQERLATVLIRAAEEREPPRAPLLLEAARLYGDVLGDRDRAIELYLATLQTAAHDPDQAREAGRALVHLLSAEGRVAERCAVLDQLAGLVEDGPERRTVLAEAARVAFDDLKDAGRAARSWRRVLDEAPGDLAALGGLIQALRAAGEGAELVDALEARARETAATSPQAARRDRVRVAHLFADELGDPARAAETWRSIREQFGPDTQSFDALSRLYEASEEWQSLVRLVAEEARAESQPERRRQLQVRLGHLQSDRLGDPIAAVKAFALGDDWTEALAAATAVRNDARLGVPAVNTLLKMAKRAWEKGQSGPDSPPARAALWSFRTLSEALCEQREYEAAVDLGLRGASLPFERRQQRELRRDAAATASARLGRPDRAIEILEVLFAEDATDDVAASAATSYAALLEARGSHATQAELWEGQARRAIREGDGAVAAALWLRAAELWESRANDVGRAIVDYTHAAELGSEPAFEVLARLHRDRGDGRRAAEALDGLLELSTEEVRAARCLRAADAYLEIGERGIARARLESALSQGTKLREVRARLAEVYRTDEMWGQLAELLDAEALEEADAGRRSALFQEVARIHADRLGDAASAVPRMERAVADSPDRPELGAELAFLLGRAGRHDDAIALLRRQVDAYEGRRPRERAVVHGQLGELLVAAGRRSDALEEWKLAAQIDPTRSDVLFRLARLAEQEDRLSDAEQTYRALLLALRRPSATDGDAPALAEVYLGLSAVARRKGDAAGADDFVESAFEAALGTEREALRLERALRSMARDDLLVRAVEARFARAPAPAQAIDALAELVSLHAAKPAADDSFRAHTRSRAELLQRSFEAEGSRDAGAWRALHHVLTWLGDERGSAGVVPAWVRSLDAESAAVDAEHLYEAAEVCLASSVHADDGARLLERALGLRPDPERAIRSLRVAALSDVTSEPSVRLLERVCRGAGREALRAQALARIAALPGAGPADVRVAVEHALALEDRALARSVLEASIRADRSTFRPADRAWTLVRLAAIAETEGRYADTIDACERAAALVSEPREGEDLLQRAATLCTTRLGEHERALALFAEVVDRRPEDPGLWNAILEVHAKISRPDALIELIDRNAPRIESSELRLPLWMRQARLLLARGSTEAALAALKRIVSSDPGHAEAADLRAELLERTGRVDELVEALGARIEAARLRGDTALGLALSLQLGSLLERALRPDVALDAYREALRMDPLSLEALRAVVRLSEEREVDPESLAQAMDALSRLEEGRAAADAALRLAAIRTEQGDDPAAERALLHGLAADATHAGILEELSTRYTERGQWSKLAEALEQVLAASPGRRDLALRLSDACCQAAQYDRAVGVLDGLAASEQDAELAHRRFVVLRAARREGEALESLEHAARLERRYVDELTAELERVTQELDIATIEPRILGLLELVERSGESRARELLRRLAQANPPPRAALEHLARIEMASENWPEAMSAYRRLLSLDAPEALEGAAVGLADACERAGRAADARADLERALAKQPASAKLFARLRALYEKIGARDQLARTYLSEASEQADPLARIGALVNAGALMLESGNDAQAIRALERAHEQEPAHIEASLLLARAFRRTSQREQALSVLGRTSERHARTRSKDVARLHSYTAELHLEGDELVEGYEAARRAFELDKSDAEAALVLGLLAIDLGEDRTALQAFQVVVMARPGSSVTNEARAVAYYHLARVAREAGDEGRARLMVTKAVKEDPTNRRARALHDRLAATSLVPAPAHLVTPARTPDADRGPRPGPGTG